MKFAWHRNEVLTIKEMFLSTMRSSRSSGRIRSAAEKYVNEQCHDIPRVGDSGAVSYYVLMARRFNLDKMRWRRRCGSRKSLSWGCRGEADPGYEWDDWPATSKRNLQQGGANPNQEPYRYKCNMDQEYDDDWSVSKLKQRDGENANLQEASENWNYERNAAASVAEVNWDCSQESKSYNKGWPSRELKEKVNSDQKCKYYERSGRRRNPRRTRTRTRRASSMMNYGYGEETRRALRPEEQILREGPRCPSG